MRVNNKLKINLIFSLINTIFQFIQSMWITSYIQRTMGVEAYGYIAVVVGIVQMAGIVSVAFTSVCSRYMVIAMEDGEKEKVNTVFSTMLYSLCALATVCVLVFLVVIFNITKVMNVSPKFVSQVSLLMLIVCLDFAIQMIQVPYFSVLYHEEKLFYTYGTHILVNIAKILIVVIVFSMWKPVLWVSHIGALGVNFAAIIFCNVYLKRHYAYITKEHRYFKTSQLKEILSSGVWVSLTKLASVLLSTCSTYMVNLVLGVYLAGVYGSVAQLQSTLSFVTVAIVSIFLPEMYKLYAQNNLSGLISYTKNKIKLISLILGIISGGLVVFGKEFMVIWISEEYMAYGLLIILSTIYLPFVYSAEMLNQVLITINKTRDIAIVSVVAGVVNIVVAVALMEFTTLGVLGVAIAQMLMAIVRALLWMPVYVAKVLKTKWYTFMCEQISGMVTIVVTVVCGSVYKYFFAVDSWLSLIFVCGLTGMSVLGILLLTNRDFKEFAETIVRRKNI